MLKRIGMMFLISLGIIGLIGIGDQAIKYFKDKPISTTSEKTSVGGKDNTALNFVPTTEINNYIKNDQVSRVVATIKQNYIDLTVYLKDGRKINTPMLDNSFSTINKLLIEKEVGVQYQVDQPAAASSEASGGGGGKSYIGDFFILVVVPLFVMGAALIGAQVYMEHRHKKKNEKKPINVEARISKTKFTDVAGIDEAKEDVCEIVDFLKNPEKYSSLGGRIPRGVILYGEPGNGKTLLARALAGEAGVPFFSASASEFVELYVGVGASRIRELFDSAKKSGPCVVFIDEVDSIGGVRGMDHNTEREQALNQLLTEMDGFEEKENVVVIAATNRLDMLDPALIRAGRFDRHIYIAKPTIKGREEIFQVYLNKIGDKLDTAVSALSLAKMTVGLTGAEISNLVNEAAIGAAKKNKTRVEDEDFMVARDKIFLGLERKNLKMNEKELKMTAYHEIGHTLVAMVIGGDPVEKVTIIPRAQALGVTLQVPETDRYSVSEKDLLNRITVLMGGRAAEEIFIGEITTGASHDLHTATQIAHQMLTQFGMGKSMGLLSNRFEGLSMASQIKVEEEVQEILTRGYKEAKSILEARAGLVKIMSEELISKETLNRAELEEMFKKG